MPIPNQKGRITRRGFFELSSGALASAGMLVGSAAKGKRELTQKPHPESADLASTPEKIALEEHFAMSESVGASYAGKRPSAFQSQIEEIGSGRIAEMDRGGAMCNYPSSRLWRREYRQFQTFQKPFLVRAGQMTIWPKASQSIPSD